MKKTGNAIIFFVLLFSLSFYPTIITNATDNKIYPTDELSNIAKTMKQNNIEINEWSVYTRGSLRDIDSKAEYDKLLEELSSVFGPGFVWGNTDSGENHFKTVGKLQNKPGIQEVLTLVAYPENGKYKTYLVYKVFGSEWKDSRTYSLKNQYEQKITQMFHKTPLIFTCVKGQTNSKMNLSLYEKAKKLLLEFSAEKIEGLNEKDFVSISGYTPQWNSAIYTQDKKMNIQISLRDFRMGGKTAVTIGTPIITSEY